MFHREQLAAHGDSPATLREYISLGEYSTRNANAFASAGKLSSSSASTAPVLSPVRSLNENS